VKYIFGVPLQTATRQQLVLEIEQRLAQHQRAIIFTPNPEILVRAYFDRTFGDIFSHDSINIADGVGIRLAVKVPVIKGRELFEDILDLLAKQNKTVLLVGSTSKVITASLALIHQRYPTLRVKGIAGPQFDNTGIPYDLEHNDQENDIIEALKNDQPIMVFVALGAPKQEFWINRMKDPFPNISFMAIGGTLDTFSGTKPLPPAWLSAFGLEWLFRLVLEPKRIGRILNALIVFPCLLVINKVSRRS
jgi:N-acetylglucosaminyldiphosphoundecaprenol N-acetyl-beta-D-mannosaminyltransferase